ncbi:hypothetical protein [Nostoc sp.]|uniref:hypothetical protein n=1 Tax=Nostoc sp. TaxID=1180 RepID=UPI002FF55B6F
MSNCLISSITLIQTDELRWVCSVYAAWITIVLDSASGVEHTSKFTLLAQGLLQEFAIFLKVFLEGIAILTVAMATPAAGIALILTLRKIFHLFQWFHILLK